MLPNEYRKKSALGECIVQHIKDIFDVIFQNNYWSMVKNVYPVWHEELREYNKRHGIPVTPRANSPRQQTLPGNFVVQIDNIRIIILLVGHCWMQMEFQSF